MSDYVRNLINVAWYRTKCMMLDLGIAVLLVIGVLATALFAAFVLSFFSSFIR